MNRIKALIGIPDDPGLLLELVRCQVTLTRSGPVYRGSCPFHDDVIDSLEVDPASGLFRCRGCGRAGDAVMFLALFEKITLVDAAKRLAKRRPETGS